MRKISAHYIFPVNAPPLKNGILVIDDQQRIVEIRENSTGKEEANLEFFNGVLIPGFVNCHCHLELSHLKNKIPAQKGLSTFLKYLLRENNGVPHAEKLHQASVYDQLMHKNGIVAAADISNTNLTIPVKKKSRIYYHTFVELFGTDLTANKKLLNYGFNLLEQFIKKDLIHSSLSPHAFYSVNVELFKEIIKHACLHNQPISLHHLESGEESDLYTKSSGSLYRFLFKGKAQMEHTGYAEKMEALATTQNPVLFVHNAHANEGHVKNISERIPHPYWVVCPSANLFIENKLPDLELLQRTNQKICIGTDSMAANSTLDMLKEINILLQNYKNRKFTEVLRWATMNGAEALNIAPVFGSFEPGKQPGIKLINKFDFANLAPSAESKVISIV